MNLSTAELQLNFAEAAAPDLRGLNSKVAFQEFSARYADFQAALDCFINAGKINEAFRLVSALVHYWMGSKRMEEGLVLLEKTLALPGGDDALRGQACFFAGYLHFWKGNYERASQFHAEALALGRASNNPTVIAIALTGFARIALQSDLAKARALCLEALAVIEGTPDKIGRANATHVLGVVAQMSGDFQEANKLMRERISLAREMGQYAVVSSESGNLSQVERQLGNLDEAEALAIEGFEIDHQRDDRMAIAWQINGLTSIAVDRGQFQRAAVLLGIADATMQSVGGQWPPDELTHFKNSQAKLIEALGQAKFDEQFKAGFATPFHEAMEFVFNIFIVKPGVLK